MGFATLYPHYDFLQATDCIAGFAALYPHYDSLQAMDCIAGFAALYPHYDSLQAMDCIAGFAALYPHYDSLQAMDRRVGRAQRNPQSPAVSYHHLSEQLLNAHASYRASPLPLAHRYDVHRQAVQRKWQCVLVCQMPHYYCQRSDNAVAIVRLH